MTIDGDWILGDVSIGLMRFGELVELRDILSVTLDRSQWS